MEMEGEWRRGVPLKCLLHPNSILMVSAAKAAFNLIALIRWNASTDSNIFFVLLSLAIVSMTDEFKR